MWTGRVSLSPARAVEENDLKENELVWRQEPPLIKDSAVTWRLKSRLEWHFLKTFEILLLSYYLSNPL